VALRFVAIGGGFPRRHPAGGLQQIDRRLLCLFLKKQFVRALINSGSKLAGLKDETTNFGFRPSLI
jgi:hypothetical protein